MTQEDIFDQNQADFYGVDVSVVRKAMKRETPHLFLVKEDGKFKSIMMTQSEYEEKYQKRNFLLYMQLPAQKPCSRHQRQDMTLN